MNSIFSEEIQQEMMAQIVDQVSKTLSVMAADKQNKRYLRYSKEAPSYCGVSQGTFNTWVIEYHIPVSVIGGVKIVDRVDLEIHISKHKK